MNFAGYGECPIQETVRVSSLFTFFRKTYSLDFTFQGESHDFYEVVCVLDGKAGITAGKNVYTLSAGQMILHPPAEFHAIWSDYGSSPEILIFSFRAEKFPEIQDRIYALTPEQIEEIKSVYSAAERAFVLDDINVKRVRSQAEAEKVVRRLEIFLLSVLNKGNGRTEQAHSRSGENYYHIVSVMEKNMEREMTADFLAKQCSMSVPALEKTVRKYTGHGAMRYYNELKMRKATELLKDEKSVKEVALSLGFSDQNYFSLRYKKWAGVPPSAVGKTK